MAVAKKHVIPVFGQQIVYSSAYFQITNFIGDKTYCEIELTVFDSDKKQFALEKRFYNFLPTFRDADYNIIRQGYAYLKTLEEFENAIDILEDGQSPLE